MEALVESGLVHFTLTATDAAIAAGAAGEWACAERHHRIAIQQAETLGSRVSQADARDWYAQMLLARGGGGDGEHARVLLSEAATLYEGLRMEQFAARAGLKAGTTKSA